MVNEILAERCGSKKLESKTPMGRPKLRWKRNIKTGLQQIGKNVMDLIDLAQDRNNWRVDMKFSAS
jgi:hypothetical protein